MSGDDVDSRSYAKRRNLLVSKIHDPIELVLPPS